MPLVLIIMGVSGSGKTTIGRLLSATLDWPFFDADDFHPPANVEKMGEGTPLTDQDRLPWLKTLATKDQEHVDQNQPMVLACSALKDAYRQVLCVDSKHIQFVYLKGDFHLITLRLQAREGHFMKASLLQSQFDGLEEPEDAIVVSINPSPFDIVETIRSSLDSHLNTPN